MADKSASFTISPEGDHYGGDSITTTTAATVVVTFPACGSTNTGREVTLLKADATTGAVQMVVAGGGLFNGKWASLYLINQGDSLTVVSNGALWIA